MLYFIILSFFAILVAIYINKLLVGNNDNLLESRIDKVLKGNIGTKEVNHDNIKVLNKNIRKEDVDEKTKVSLDRLKKFGLIKPDVIKEKLNQAGFRKNNHIVYFVFTKIILPIVLPLIFLLYNNYIAETPFIGFKYWGGLIGSFLAGFYGPDSWLSDKVKKRLENIDVAYPEALDMLLISIEAGSSLNKALEMVVDELSDPSPEIAEEFGMLIAELSYLSKRKQAFRNLAIRVPIIDMKPLVTAFIQSDASGTPLAPALRILASENRRSRLLRAEKKAASIPAKLTVPLVLFIFPSLFVVILGPAIVDLTINGLK